MKNEGILLHQYTIHDEKGKVVRKFKATKKTRKMLARLAHLAKQEWPNEEPFIMVLEPKYQDFGYVPRTVLLAKGKSADETIPGSRNRYMISALNPATIKTCEQQDLWKDDVAWFEDQVKKGNYVKVKVSYDKNGKVSVGAQVVVEARKEAVDKKKEADKKEEERKDDVPPDIPSSVPTKKEKAEEGKSKSGIKRLLSKKKEGKK